VTPVVGWDGVDWSRPWLAPWRARGEALVRRALQVGLVTALNEALPDDAQQRFVRHAELPPGEAYEAFIARTHCVPTRDNLHDLLNGLVWGVCPVIKHRLNALQAAELARAAPGTARGAVRDALTVFDENAALLHAPPALVDALRARDWHALFVTQRSAWADAQLTLFGHALIEKLAQPRKAITAHVWLLDQPLGDGAALTAQLTPQRLAAKPFLPLPVLGVPGWWPANDDPAFYDDPAVFRPAKRNSGPQAAV
jgi:hypothetical protein